MRKSVYIFIRNGTNWVKQAKLTPDDGAVSGSFGVSVSISIDGNTVLVGAPEYIPSTNAGSAYVFERSGGNWSQSERLRPGDGAGWHGFGEAVALSGDGRSALMGAGYGFNSEGVPTVAPTFMRTTACPGLKKRSCWHLTGQQTTLLEARSPSAPMGRQPS
jgi:hypothetical protein